MVNLKIIQSDLLKLYQEQVFGIKNQFENLKEAEISSGTFSLYTSVASVYSSKIEGVDIELDSYIKHKSLGISFKPNYTKKIDDLYDAYLFAKFNPLNKANISKAHKLLSKNLVATAYQGKLRSQIMYVITDDGKIEYVAVSPNELKDEMNKFYHDIEILKDQNLSVEEVFYYAAFIHLVFVKIHPWNDGNGRTARLIEKWFIAEHLGEKAWFLLSEKNYYLQHQSYYQNLRKLGNDYPELDYNQALSFLLMLPNSLDL